MLGRQDGEGLRVPGRPRAHRDILLAIDGVADRKAADHRSDIDLPEPLAGLVIERTEAPVHIPAKDALAAGGHERHCGGPLLIGPERLARLGRDRLYHPQLVGAGRELVTPHERIQVDGEVFFAAIARR